jgi:hypothetical protein
MSPVGPKFVVAANVAKDVPGLLTQADGVTAGIEAHPGFFPNSGPIVQGIKEARKALGDKLAATSPLKRARQTRSPEERTLRNRLIDGARFVESCANDDLENGEASIVASTFSRKATGKRKKGLLKLKYGEASGSILADAKASKYRSAFYWWRFSLDNGLTWVEPAGTNTSKTLLESLPVAKTVLVQVAVTEKNVRSPWSDSASVLVH